MQSIVTVYYLYIVECATINNVHLIQQNEPDAPSTLPPPKEEDLVKQRQQLHKLGQQQDKYRRVRMLFVVI